MNKGKRVYDHLREQGVASSILVIPTSKFKELQIICSSFFAIGRHKIFKVLFTPKQTITESKG